MCAEIGCRAGRNKLWSPPNAAFGAKTRGRTKVLPLAGLADAQLAPGSCLVTAWRSHSLTAPVCVCNTLYRRPIGASFNLWLSLMCRQAFWLGAADPHGAGAVD